MSKRDPKNPLGLPPERLEAANAIAQRMIEQMEETVLDLPRHEQPVFLRLVIQQADAHLRAMLEQPGLSGADKEVLEMRLRENERSLAEMKRELEELQRGPAST